MFKIENKQIFCTRGDKGTIRFRFPIELNEDGAVKTYYTFQKDDKITFGVWGKSDYEKDAVILKDVIVLEESEYVDIPLTSKETKIGDYINRKKDYWYQITLNDEQTLMGFDEITGAKIFTLLPEGREEE